METKIENYMVSRLKEIRDLSHTLRKSIYKSKLPLSGILNGYNGEINDVLKRNIEIAYLGLNEIEKKIIKILSIANSQSPVSLNKTNTSIADIVYELIHNYKKLAEKHKIEIIFNDSEEVLYANIDKEKMTDALHNLIGNAIDYNIEGGKLLVNFIKKGSNIIIVIADNGLGYHTKKEPFFQPESKIKICKSTESNKVGVDSSLNIIERHEGKLSIYSPLDKNIFPELELDDIRIGTAIYIQVPIE